MNWLSPWFLIGGLAVLGPLIAHLRRRDERRELLFPAQRFVRERKPPETQRRRLQDLVLLALRALALGGVSFAFARPFFDTEIEGRAASTKRVVVLVDRSASLRGESEVKVREVLRGMSGDFLDVADVSVAVFDSGVREVVTAEEWAKADRRVRQALWERVTGGWEPSWGGTGLDEALRYASVRMVGEDGFRARSGEVVVVSDFQQGSRIAGARDLPWPPGVSVRLHRIEGFTPSASVRWLPPEEGVPAKDWRFEVRAHRAGGRVAVSIEEGGTDGGSGVVREERLELGDGQRRVLKVPMSASGLVRVRVGRGVAPEEVAYAAAKVRRALRVRVVGEEDVSGAGARHFFETAVRSYGEVELVDREGAADVVAWVGRGDATEVEGVAARVRSGAVGLLWAGDGLEGETLKALTASGVELGAVEERTMGISGIDRGHWVMKPMVQARFDDLSGLRFWRTRRMVLGLDDRVILTFDDGRPALAEVSLGQGCWLVWSCGLGAQDGQFGLSTRFLPWLAGVLERVRGEGGDVRPVVVGRSVQGVEARPVFPRADVVKGGLEVPGVFQGEDGTRWVVSVPPEEMHREALADAQLRALGLPLEVRASGGETDERGPRGGRVAERLESEQSLWKRLVWGVVMILLLESLIAGRRSRKSQAAS
jgi:hypothetical protein